ncbi:MAG: hypothetical protein OXD33_10005 [Rhodobacteraceae bacterium]|nr:hypothetical protein [Paracoccaceae bacterium]
MLTENDVVEAVAGYLDGHGWIIIKTANTHPRGPDILATRDGTDLVIEAKGGTSSKRTSHRDKPFTPSQMLSHVAKALDKAACPTGEGHCKPGIAVPTTDRHRNLAKDIFPALKSLGVVMFLVDEDHKSHDPTEMTLRR